MDYVCSILPSRQLNNSLMKTIFITGNSQGLGLGLTRYFLDGAHTVYGLSRSPCPIKHAHLHQRIQDLSKLQQIDTALSSLLPEKLDLVILNAGMLGKISDLADTSLEEVQTLMDTNVWSNKIIIDWLIRNHVEVKQLILMSSGASVNGNRGWGIYSISKASINMMAQLYAHEMPDTHITAYAPGLIQTKMQDYLCHHVDTQKFPSVSTLVNAYQTPDMPEIDQAAQRIGSSFNLCLQFNSGSFVDIRDL